MLACLMLTVILSVSFATTSIDDSSRQMLHMIVVIVNVLFMLYLAFMALKLIIKDIMYNNEKLYLWLHSKFSTGEELQAKAEKIKTRVAQRQKKDLKQRQIDLMIRYLKDVANNDDPEAHANIIPHLIEICNDLE